MLGALQRHADPGDRARAALAPARRSLPGPSRAVRVASLPPESAAGSRPDVRAYAHLGAAGCGVLARGRRDRRLLRHLRDPPLGRRPAGAVRIADGGAEAGMPSDRVLRHAVHRPVRCDVRLQRRHRVLRRGWSNWRVAPTCSCARRPGPHAPDRPPNLHLSGTEAGRSPRESRCAANCC